MGLFCGMQLAVWYSGIHFFGGQPFRGNMGTSWGPQLTRWYHPPAVLCLFWDMLGLGSDSFEIVVIYIYVCIYVVCICKCICIFICICIYVENINYYYYYYLYIYSIFTLCAYCIAYISLYIYICIYMHIIIPYEPTSPIQPIIRQSVNPCRFSSWGCINWVGCLGSSSITGVHQI